MQKLFGIDWQSIFVPDTSIAEMILRGSLVYLGVFFLLRFFLKRQTGNLGLADLLTVVLIADAAQNAMASEYRSITNGLVLVGTIVFWNFFLDWLGDRFPKVERVLRPAPVLLIQNGQLLRRNMRKEYITEDELQTELRKQGVGNSAEVKAAFMEGDGRISVLKLDSEHKPSHGNDRPVF